MNPCVVLTERDLRRIRRKITQKESCADDDETELLTLEEAQVAILDWLASKGHKVDYR